MTRIDFDNWRDYAACLDEDPELFWPVGTTGPALAQAEEAKTVCKRCPAQRFCLQAALNTEGGSGREARHGIWGGLTGDERHALYRRTARGRSPSPA